MRNKIGRSRVFLRFSRRSVSYGEGRPPCRPTNQMPFSLTLEKWDDTEAVPPTIERIFFVWLVRLFGLLLSENSRKKSSFLLLGDEAQTKYMPA
jgi:hypothetical protein